MAKRQYRMRDIIVRDYGGKSPDEVIPGLIREHKTPYLVAIKLGVYPHSVQHWLKDNGWRRVDGIWQSPDEQT